MKERRWSFTFFQFQQRQTTSLLLVGGFLFFFFLSFTLCHNFRCLSVCVSTAGLDIGPLTDGSPVAPQSQTGRRTPRTIPEEPLDGILSPELDKMVTDGQCVQRNLQHQTDNQFWNQIKDFSFRFVC